GQRTVGRFGSGLMALPSPVQWVDSRTLPIRNFGREIRVEIGGILIRRAPFHAAHHQVPVPHSMEIGCVGFLRGRTVKRAAIRELDRDAVSAPVPIIGTVERLMEVTHKMNDKAQGIGAFRGGFRLILQNLHLIVNGFGYATFGVAELRKIVWSGDAERNIEEVPRAGLGMQFAVVVGPGGGVCEPIRNIIAAETRQIRIDGIVLQEIGKSLTGLRRQVPFGKQGHGLVPVASPGAGGRGISDRNERAKEQEGDRNLRAVHDWEPPKEWCLNLRERYRIAQVDSCNRRIAWFAKYPGPGEYSLETNVPGVFAAGDVRHGSVKRYASAVGEETMAVTFVHHYLVNG